MRGAHGLEQRDRVPVHVVGLDEERDRGQAIGENPLQRGAGPLAFGRSLVAAGGPETRDLMGEVPAFALGLGVRLHGRDHAVSAGVVHHVAELFGIHTRIELQFGKGHLLEDVALGVQRLHLDDQAALLFGPDAVAVAQGVARRELDHFGVKAGDALVPLGCGVVVALQRRGLGTQTLGKQAQRLAPLGDGDMRLRQEGHDLVVAPERAARRARQRLDPFDLLAGIAGVPDPGAGHGTLGR